MDVYVQRSKSDESAGISTEISQGLIPSNYTALTRPARNGPSLPGRNTNPRIVILACRESVFTLARAHPEGLRYL